MSGSRATRGHGLLEPLLARLRARQAERLFPDRLRPGRILDIGCGSSPYFLAHTYFQEKYAVDQLPPAPGHEAILWHTLDLNRDPSLPFEEGHFSVVTMLAVAEHLDPGALERLLIECRRILGEDGRLVLTTPAANLALLHLTARDVASSIAGPLAASLQT